MTQIVQPGRVNGWIDVPASKSHTIRALLVASLASGESLIVNPLDSADCRSCRTVCRKLGAVVEKVEGKGQAPGWRIKGNGGCLPQTGQTFDVGNSGTTLFLATSVAGLGSAPFTFTGDEQVKTRSAGPLLSSLAELGATVIKNNRDCPPFTIRGPARGGQTTISCPTSQYLSGLLLAAPLFPGDTVIRVSELNEKPYIDLTLYWLDRQNICYKREGYSRFIVKGGQAYRGFTQTAPGDFSSATFFMCAAAVTGGRVTLRGLDTRDPQGDKAVLGHLEKMGCRVSVKDDCVEVAGPRSGRLKATDLDLNATPDALPALAAVACRAEGTTCIYNTAQARIKETDRIAVMAAELKKMGARVKETADGLIVEKSRLQGAEVSGARDHRVVMALAVAALAADGQTAIETAEAAAITYPGFFSDLKKLTG